MYRQHYEIEKPVSVTRRIFEALAVAAIFGFIGFLLAVRG